TLFRPLVPLRLAGRPGSLRRAPRPSATAGPPPAVRDRHRGTRRVVALHGRGHVGAGRRGRALRPPARLLLQDRRLDAEPAGLKTAPQSSAECTQGAVPPGGSRHTHAATSKSP